MLIAVIAQLLRLFLLFLELWPPRFAIFDHAVDILPPEGFDACARLLSTAIAILDVEPATLRAILRIMDLMSSVAAIPTPPPSKVPPKPFLRKAMSALPTWATARPSFPLSMSAIAPLTLMHLLPTQLLDHATLAQDCRQCQRHRSGRAASAENAVTMDAQAHGHAGAMGPVQEALVRSDADALLQFWRPRRRLECAAPKKTNHARRYREN